jgi:hypothetical protein
MVYVLRIALNLRQGVPDFKTAFRLDIDLRQLLTMAGASAIDTLLN